MFIFSYDETLAAWFYYDFSNGETQWNHPLDEFYKQKVIEARADVCSKEAVDVRNSDTEHTIDDITNDCGDKLDEVEEDQSEYKEIHFKEELVDNSTDTSDKEVNMLPLTPLGPIGQSKPALPPLKKLAPLGSIDKPPLGSIEKRPALGRIGSDPEMKVGNNDDEEERQGSPAKTSRGLKLGMGKSFLKTESTESLDHRDSSEQNSVRSTSSQKGILKTQTPETLLRQAMMQRDEKRIMFNLGANMEFASEVRFVENYNKNKK